MNYTIENIDGKKYAVINDKKHEILNKNGIEFFIIDNPYNNYQTLLKKIKYGSWWKCGADAIRAVFDGYAHCLYDTDKKEFCCLLSSYSEFHSYVPVFIISDVSDRYRKFFMEEYKNVIFGYTIIYSQYFMDGKGEIVNAFNDNISAFYHSKKATKKAFMSYIKIAKKIIRNHINGTINDSELVNNSSPFIVKWIICDIYDIENREIIKNFSKIDYNIIQRVKIN